jgi:pimeloyl-ACP methyl ester carboxylesterase
MVRKFFLSEKSNGIHFHKLPSKSKSDRAIVFIHGIIGSHRCWSSEFLQLQENASLYFIDLLGFGYSSKPPIAYTLQDHLDALHTFISTHVLDKEIILVGHSTGSIIAEAYAARYPEKTSKVFLLSLPYYHSEKEASEMVASTQAFRYFAWDTLATRLTCLIACTLFGPLTRQIAPLFNRTFPKAVVQDYFRHSYISYMRSLVNVVYKQHMLETITKTKRKLILIHGVDDTTVPQEHVKELSEKFGIPLYIVQNADHFLPTFAGEKCVAIIKKEI